MIQKRTITFGFGPPLEFKNDDESAPCGRFACPLSLNDATCNITETVSSHEYAAHDEQHDFLAHDHREGAERGADWPRPPHIAHEYLGRIGVEPEKSQAGAHQGGAENQRLADPGDVGNLQGTSRT